MLVPQLTSAPPGPPNGQHNHRRWENTPQPARPVWGAAAPGRVHDPRLVDLASQGNAGYHLQPQVGVGHSFLSATESPFD